MDFSTWPSVAVFLGPPVFEVALGVVLTAFVVEAVGELVADGGAGVAVVRGVIGLWIVEGWLEDSRGKVHVVHLRVVVGVDGGRSHVPLGAIDGLAYFGPLAGVFEARGTEGVAEVVIGLDLKLGV